MNKKSSTVDTSISKRLLISLLTIGMALNISGCSSGGSSDDESGGGDETFAEESSGDFEDGEEGGEEASDVADGENGSDLEEGGEFTEEGAEEGADVAEGDDVGEELGDEELDGELADSSEESGDGLVEEGGGDVAASDDDELSLDDEEGLPEDVAGGSGNEPSVDAMAPIEEPSTPPTDAPVFADNVETPVDAPVDAPIDAPMEEPAPAKVWLPLLKVKSAAFEAGGTNLNRVYVGRPGDTVKGVAEKLYGDSGRSSDLRNWNKFLSRGVKTGDKIYYSSPTNPTDTNMLTYYEDVSIPAQNYVSRDGDNIREVSKTLLGNNDSWKEIWATNPDVESKGDIPGGLNLRYWPEDSVPAPVLANTLPPVDPNQFGQDPLAQQPMGQDPLAQQQPMMGQDSLGMPPSDPLPPSDPVAQMPPIDPLAQPTPASDPTIVGTTEPPPPPIDPPQLDQAPSEPATQAAATVDNSDPVAGTDEADQMMTMGLAGIVLLAAGAVFFLMRRNRSKKIDLTQTTQVG